MKKDYTIAVAGTGYVGLSIATLLSQHHKVMAVDIVKEKVDLINNRKSPIQDNYIEKYLAEKELNLTATLDAKEAYSNAERCRTYKIRQEQVRLLKEIPSEENLWQSIIAFQNYPFKTATGLPFRYKLKVGKNGEYNRELLIDRREKSKSLAWSSVVLAFENSKRISEEVKKPKALGDIRGVSYIYPILWRFGLIRVPEEIEKKMGKQR